MTTNSITDIIRRFQVSVRRGDTELAARLMRQYKMRRRVIEKRLREYRRLIREASGVVEAERWVVEETSIRNLLRLAETEMNSFARYAAEQIEARQIELIAAAKKHDEVLTYASIEASGRVTPAARDAIQAAFNAIPTDAVEAVVGALSDGSPLRDLFNEFGETASKGLSEALIRGVTRGDGAERIARSMVQNLDGNAARALTIARTETHRAYRSASLDRYKNNTNIYAGWEWYAELDQRTCTVCYAKHGTVHSVDEEFGSHPNCRCRPVPITRSVSDILGESSPESLALDGELLASRASQTPGSDVFDGLSAAQQDRIVGNTKGSLYRGGQLTLADMVVESRHPRWGLQHRAATINEALQNATRR